MQGQRVLSREMEEARAGEEGCEKPFRKSSKKRTVAREVAKVEALSKVSQRARFFEVAHAQMIHEARVMMMIEGTNSIGCFAFGLHGCDV